MATDLKTALLIAASGMKAQGGRMRVVSENIANAQSFAEKPGGDPYTRKTTSFKSIFDREIGANLVEQGKVKQDKNVKFEKKYDPHHPSADESGYIKVPNVNLMMEMMDMRQAQRSYDANLGIIEISRAMLMKTIELLA